MEVAYHFNNRKLSQRVFPESVRPVLGYIAERRVPKEFLLIYGTSTWPHRVPGPSRWCNKTRSGLRREMHRDYHYVRLIWVMLKNESIDGLLHAMRDVDIFRSTSIYIHHSLHLPSIHFTSGIFDGSVILTLYRNLRLSVRMIDEILRYPLCDLYGILKAALNVAMPTPLMGYKVGGIICCMLEFLVFGVNRSQIVRFIEENEAEYPSEPDMACWDEAYCAQLDYEEYMDFRESESLPENLQAIRLAMHTLYSPPEMIRGMWEGFCQPGNRHYDFLAKDIERLSRGEDPYHYFDEGEPVIARFYCNAKTLINCIETRFTFSRGRPQVVTTLGDSILVNMPLDVYNLMADYLLWDVELNDDRRLELRYPINRAVEYYELQYS